MRAYDIIKKKRDGEKLNPEEINFFVKGITNGEIADYQTTALCMAIFLRGMDEEETAALTYAVRDSGQILDFDVGGLRVDKHSTGGVGDKTSLVVMPIVAACGCKVAKMSGRGLGHTGGTVDKLEAIPGFKTSLDISEFVSQVREIGIAIVGQSAQLAPADKKLYALRDVTATVDSLPLIVSSIMGKKLAANDDCMVFDVKTGSGSFCKTIEQSRLLARQMVNIGMHAGKKVMALITDMDVPLGRTIGNSLEVVEAIEALHGQSEADLRELSIALAASLLKQAGHGSFEQCKAEAAQALDSGAALKKLACMVEAQGGDSRYVYDSKLFGHAQYMFQLRSPETGYIQKVNTESYGTASLLLGAGRNKASDSIDYRAGIKLNKKTGDYVERGDVIATLYSEKNDFDGAVNCLLKGTVIGDQPDKKPLIIDIIE